MSLSTSYLMEISLYRLQSELLVSKFLIRQTYQTWPFSQNLAEQVLPSEFEFQAGFSSC